MNRNIYALFLVLMAAILQPWLCRAQGEAVPEVYLINIDGGGEIYELDGHSAIGIIYPDDRAEAYNYGVFDFGAPNFVWRFVKGETDYMCAVYPLQYFLYSYSGTGRTVEAAQIDMDSIGTARLLEILRHDASPEFRTYRYNYVLDNCATRPLNAIERAIGDSIILAPGAFEGEIDTPLTFRRIMAYNHRNYPWYQFGIDLALGSGIDRPISRRECAFAPVELMQMLPEATAGGRPLVREVITIQSGNPTIAQAAPTPFFLTPLFAGCIVLALAILLSVRDCRRGKTTRWFDSALFGLFGLTSLVLTFLIFVSTHEATSPNYLYIWLNPLAFIASIGIWIKCARKVVIWYYFINFVAVTGLVAAWYWLPQSGNIAFVPFVAADLLRSACYVYVNRKNLKCAASH